jgi:hypothetical protein
MELDAKNFYFKNGRLKYCPPLLSLCHNIAEVSKARKTTAEIRKENI